MMKSCFRVVERLLFVLPLIAVLGLSGCATSRLLPLEDRMQPTASVPADHGVVVLKVQRGQGSLLAPANLRWQRLALRAKAQGGKSLWAGNQQPEYAEHSLFVLPVPAGDYTPETLEATYFVGTAQYEYKLSLPEVNEFSVRAGEITDLGTLVLLPSSATYRMGSRRTGQSVLALPLANSVAESSQLLSIVRSRMPASLKLASGKPWRPTPLSEGFADARSRADLSQRFASLVIQGDTAYAGEDFGLVRVRRGKDWSWLDTGLGSRVSGLAVLPDGALVAGGHHGAIRWRAAGSEAWQDWVLPLRDSVIVGLHAHPRHGLFAAARHGTELVVFRAERPGSPWSESRRVSANGFISTQIQTSLGNEALYLQVSETGFSVSSNLHRLELASGMWNTVPVGGGALNIVQDRLFAMGGSSLSPSFRQSLDGGRTWTPLSTPDWPMALAMLDENEGYIVRVDKIGIVSAAGSSFSLWRTTDGGRNWSTVGPAPAWLGRIVRGPAGELWSVPNPVGAGMPGQQAGRFAVSTDDGKTWTEAPTGAP
jgi:hypothetical protein